MPSISTLAPRYRLPVAIERGQPWEAPQGRCQGTVPASSALIIRFVILSYTCSRSGDPLSLLSEVPAALGPKAARPTRRLRSVSRERFSSMPSGLRRDESDSAICTFLHKVGTGYLALVRCASFTCALRLAARSIP